LLLLTCLLPASSNAQSSDHKDDRRVVVTRGEAIVRRAPDRALLILATEVRAPQPAQAQQRNAEMMSAVQQTLQGLVPADAIRTLAYTLQEEFEYVNDRRVSRGYRAANTIEVRVDDLPQLGRIIDAAVESGATNVHNIQFELKDRDGAEREALRLAVADARGRAEAAAAGANLQLAGVVRIEEQGRAVPMVSMARMEMDAARAETPIAPGEIEIRATVMLTAEIR
jgi:hypothetical protein